MPETCDVRLNFRVTVRQARALGWLATKNRSTRSAEERAWLDGLVAEQEREERERDAGHSGRSDGQAQDTDH
jgi:hypothetical protein